MALSKIRNRLQTFRSSSTEPYLRRFVPDGAVQMLLQYDEILDVLREEVFSTPTHKRQSTAKLICDDAPKVFAILLELHSEHLLFRFIESDTLDSRLPLDQPTLKRLIPEAEERFECLQHEYLAYRFRSAQYHKKLSKQQVLPYIDQVRIGGGGYSSVFRVRVHASHQNFLDKTGPDVSYETFLFSCDPILTPSLGYTSHPEGAQALRSRRASRS